MNPNTPIPKSSDKTVQLDPTAFVSSAPPQIPDHELLRRVGEGAYGEVWLARNVMGTYRAVKIVYRRSFSDERPYEREFAGIKKFEPISRAHGSQVDILHVGRNDAAGYFFYVMELADDSSVECGVQSAELSEGAPTSPQADIYSLGKVIYEAATGRDR